MNLWIGGGLIYIRPRTAFRPLCLCVREGGVGLDLARTGFSKGYEMGSRLFIFERRIRFMELTTDHSFSSCHRRPRPPPPYNTYAL